MLTLPLRPSFFGWHVVAAVFVLAVFGWGIGFYGPPVFLHAVVARTGWPVALVSAAVTLHFLSGALFVAALPRLYGRLGVAQTTCLGALLLAAGITGWAIAGAPWQLFAASLLSGAGWVTMGAAAVNALIAPWFDRQRPAALSMAYNGASLGGVIFSPLWVVLIAKAGFLPATLAVGIVMLICVTALSVFVFSRTPAGLGQHPDGAAVAAPAPEIPPGPQIRLWHDRRFVTLAAGMALGLFAQIGLLAHLFSLLATVLGAEAAGFAMGAATLAAIAGRTVTGWLLPAGSDRRLVACLSYGVQLCGSLLFILSAGDSALWLIAGLMLFGLGIGNATSLPPLIAQAEFTPAQVRRVVPLIVATGQAGYAFAPAAFGLLRTGQSADTGTALFFVAALVQAGAIAAMLAGRTRRR